MGKIIDLLADIPINANLRLKIKALEDEITELERENRCRSGRLTHLCSDKLIHPGSM